jgi:hypothetical protein
VDSAAEEEGGGGTLFCCLRRSVAMGRCGAAPASEAGTSGGCGGTAGVTPAPACVAVAVGGAPPFLPAKRAENSDTGSDFEAGAGAAPPFLAVTSTGATTSLAAGTGGGGTAGIAGAGSGDGLLTARSDARPTGTAVAVLGATAAAAPCGAVTGTAPERDPATERGPTGGGRGPVGPPDGLCCAGIAGGFTARFATTAAAVALCFLAAAATARTSSPSDG